VLHVVDLAEVPTVQLGQQRPGVDTDRDGTLSDRADGARRRVRRIAPLLCSRSTAAAR
jgi:hypothetical protein